MEVTIIIPVYNRADVVQATLDSVVAQTHRPLQLVLVDNCSTDNTLQVLETFRKEHPSLNVVITQEQHHTAGAARNRGFEQATGEWVLFFDSDDQMEPGLVASYVKKIERANKKGRALDLISVRSTLVFPDGSKRKAVSTDLYGKAVVDLFFVMACDEDKSFEDALATLQVDSSKLGKAGELGQSGEYKYYYFSGDYSEYENELREALTDEFYPEYKALLADVENIAAGITLTEPKKLKSGTTLGNKISFETKDLDGNTVTSEELFAQNKVTMINIWATWCGPCKNELSELEKMNTEIEAKGCKIIGICDDAAEGASTIKEAKSILEEKGVHYLNLQQTAEIKSLLPPLAYPTTYFVDSEGRLLTEPVVGTLFSEYHARLDEALEIVEGAE